MDMFLFCLVNSDYIMFVELITEYLKNKLKENIVFMKHYQNIYDYIGCSLFDMYIESKYTSKECDSEFTLEEYQISTNVSIYINIFTEKINDGLYVIKEIVESLGDSFDTNIILEDDSSAVVYINACNRHYVNKAFWNQKVE